jgi:hypothetical protein
MKIKLNKEQIAYVNGLEDPEAKKDFLINCFLTQCEEEIKKEEQNLLKFDLPKNNEKGYVSFKDGKFATSDRDLAFALLHFPHLCKPEDSGREKFDKFIEDNGLKKFTPPEIELPVARELREEKIKELILLMHKQPMVWSTLYTKEDLQSAFEASRQDIMGITLFKDFEEYFRAIS